MALKDKLRVGCSGWGYDDWLGGFYPPGTPKSDYLKLYGSVFDCVEVDSSFYRNPGPAMTKGWYKSTPPGFLFARSSSATSRGSETTCTSCSGIGTCRWYGRRTSTCAPRAR